MVVKELMDKIGYLLKPTESREDDEVSMAEDCPRNPTSEELELLNKLLQNPLEFVKLVVRREITTQEYSDRNNLEIFVHREMTPDEASQAVDDALEKIGKTRVDVLAFIASN